MNPKKERKIRSVINVIHQRLYLFQLIASVLETKIHERMLPLRKNHAKNSAFSVICNEEVVLLKITPLFETPNP